MIETLRVRIPAGAAGEFSSAELTLCADSYSVVSVNRSQSSLKLLSFNSQSCRQIATDIYDLIVDNSIDVLMLTETWLYFHGDEAYIAAMTPAGYQVRSFPQAGSRGGGIGSTFQKFNTFQKFHCVCVWV